MTKNAVGESSDCARLTVAILAGGVGTRLWPLSRAARPKQLLPLVSQESMLNLALQRAIALKPQKLIIICNEEHCFFVREEANKFDLQVEIILEPFGKNTAPAAALAALRSDAEGLTVLMPADHIFSDPEAFASSVLSAIGAIDKRHLVTFGAPATVPSTQYGYIEKGKASFGGYAIKQFVEKPEMKLAESFLDSGGFLWNCGIFLFSPRTFLSELHKYNRQLLKACEIVEKNLTPDLQFLRISPNLFCDCEDISIDYAVMEKTKSAIVYPLDAGWSDLGSWQALHDLMPKDERGNTVGNNTIAVDSTNSYLRSDGGLLVTLGMEDAVVVQTKDATLVANKSHMDSFKDVIHSLKLESRAELIENRETYRPWGKYDSLERGERFQIKKITVSPGERLSTQMHFHRAEHWIVVSGTAKVFKKDDSFILTEDQSTYIPIGEIHSLENPGKVPLELIEVQTGSYLKEDDIVRFRDSYGRVSPSRVDDEKNSEQES